MMPNKCFEYAPDGAGPRHLGRSSTAVRVQRGVALTRQGWHTEFMYKVALSVSRRTQ